MNILKSYLGGQAAAKAHRRGVMEPPNPMAEMGGFSMPNNFAWDEYLVGGGTRPDAISGLGDEFEVSLSRLFNDAPPEVKASLRVTSGYRSEEKQSELWDAALKKYGSPEAARKWVAPPGRSKHNHGMAADLKFLSPVAQEWVHRNASRYGLHFPLSNEPWHVEPVGSRGNPMSSYARS